MDNHAIALTANYWNDSTVPNTTGVVTTEWGTNFYWPQSWWYYPATRIETAKVRLKFSEVEALKRACKDNPKLREVLVKLTPAIEVEIDL